MLHAIYGFTLSEYCLWKPTVKGAGEITDILVNLCLRGTGAVAAGTSNAMNHQTHDCWHHKNKPLFIVITDTEL